MILRASSIACILMATLLIPLVSLAEEASVDEFMSVDEIKPGMKGVGRTVFSGMEIEEFNVEIVGILRNEAPQRDFILARLSGGPLEKTGVIAGMSGSPVYVDGRLIGAVAYAWSFSTEPLAGITPIKDMMGVLERDAEEEEDQGVVFAFLNAGFLSGDPDAEGLPRPVVAFTEPMEFGALRNPLKPIRTPLVFAGCGSQLFGQISPLFESLGMMPMQGGTLTLDEESQGPFEPGAALGVQLLRGDMSISAIGTLTYRRGNRIAGFGHPMMSSGTVDLPMTSAYIHTILPSQMVSTKVGSAVASVGSIRQDRAAAIAGIVGRVPDMIPVEVALHRRGGQTSRFYRYEVVRNRFLAPSMVSIALSNSIVSTEKSRGDFTARIHYEIDMGDLGTISNDEFISGTDMLPLASTMPLSQTFSALMVNDFQKVRVERISIEVSLEDTARMARLKSVRVSKDILKPGEDVEVTLSYKPYRGESRKEKVLITIPDDAPEGKLSLTVSDARTAKAKSRARAPFRYRPTNIHQLIELLDEDVPSNEIVLELMVPSLGLAISGQEMPSLPTSVLSVLSSSRERGLSGITKGTVLAKKTISTNFRVRGASILALKIDREAR